MAQPIPYGAANVGRPLSIARGVAGLGEIVGATYRQMRLVENINASGNALEEAYLARTAAVRAATGIDMGNPLIAELTPDIYAQYRRQRPDAGFDDLGWMQMAIEQQRKLYDDRLWQLAAQYPQHSAAIRASTPLARDAEKLAAQSDAELNRLMQASPGWEGVVASFVGGAGGAMTDPLTAPSLFLGGGPGAARTVAGRILSVATKEALLNGATEAAAQPFVQDWRRQAGLDHGYDEAARNVLFAATLGGLLGAGGRGGYEALTALARSRGSLSPVADRALAGDLEAQRQMLSELPHDSLPPEVRGALDAIDIAEVSPLAGDDAVSAASIRRAEILESRAALHAQNPALAAIASEPIGIDEDQVARILGEYETSLARTIDTRGQGVQYHGTSREIVEIDEGHYNSANIYGNGFYTTDALDVARNYTGKGKGPAPTVYKIEEKRPVRFADMEQSIDTLPGDLYKTLTKDDPLFAEAHRNFVNSQERRREPSLRELVDELRDISAGQGWSRDEVQGALESLRYNLVNAGFGGMSHRGGLRTNTPEHRVKIYFDPQNDIALNRMDGSGPGATAKAQSRPTTQFIKSIGGVEPGSPLAQELRARGIDNRAMPGLYRKGGLTDLDNVPFAELPPALQARMRPEGETVYARQQDLLDAIEDEAGGGARSGSLPAGPTDEMEARLVDIDAKVRRVLAGRPGSDDAFVREAIDLAESEGLDIDAAVGRLEAEKAGTRQTLPESQFADLPAEPEDLASLEASLMERAGPEGDDGIDFAALEAAGFGDDALIAWGDGTISIADLRTELEETRWLESIVAACKV